MTVTTWQILVDEARESVEDAYPTREDRDTLRGWEESGDGHEAAHEYADGHHRVIYYSESRALFAAGLLDDYEDEARELAPSGGFESVDQWLTVAAYCALRAAYLEAVSVYVEAWEPEDAAAAAE